jgi:dTDP-4-amino-4,6-dideoxygalactose transaminase
VYQKEPWSCGFGCPGKACRHLEESERAQDHAIIIPLFPHMTDEEQDQVVAAVHEVLVASMAAAR